jgi:uncharacterized membrane protein
VHFGAAFATSFLASAVEAIEMVAIVVGVGAVRGWKSSLIGAAAGLVVLAVVGTAFGRALTLIPIGILRLVVGVLLLVFGLQWLTKGIRRVAARGFAGDAEEETPGGASKPGPLGLDWLSFVLSFKGVLLEGLEIAFIVVTFGAAASDLSSAAVGGAAALVAVAAIGGAFHRALQRIPRSMLILVVGLLLSTFGTFWSAEGVGVDWPGGDLALIVLLPVYAAVAATLVVLARGRIFGLVPEGTQA